jgi:hypothetical protein
MKIYKLMMFVLVVGFVASCSTDYDVNEYFDLEELPGYVAFDADGNDVNVSDRSIAEDGGSVSIAVENPTGTTSDITVNYAISGDAVFGVDYTIAGATASGGSLTISSDRGNVAVTYRGNIVVTALTDDVIDGNKTLTLTLTSASNASGELAVGRGGKDFQRTANVIFEDIDM